LRKYIYLIFCFTLLFSCQQSPQVVKTNTTFFDLKIYFKEQLEDLKKIKKIKKSTFFDGVEEVQIIDAPNFEKELALFIDSNINKNAWMDKYKVDSLFESSGQLSQVSYIALEQKMKTQSIDLFMEGSEISSIKIINRNNNVISNSEQYLEYFPKKGYNINNKQTVSFSPEHSLKVNVRYLK